MRKAGEVFSLDHYPFIARWMKTIPITREFSRLRVELCPPFLSINRVDLFLISPGVVVDNHIGIRAEVVLMQRVNEILKLRAIAVERFDGPLLIEVPKVEIIVRVVARRTRLRTFADGRQPQCIDAGLL